MFPETLVFRNVVFPETPLVFVHVSLRGAVLKNNAVPLFTKLTSPSSAIAPIVFWSTTHRLHQRRT